MPGELTQEGAQISKLFLLQSAAAADGNGTTATTDGFNGAQMIEIQKMGTGTVSANFEGSFDGSNWYAIGYYQVDAIAPLLRSVSAFSVLTGTVKHVFQMLDLYPNLRCRLSATSGTVAVTANLYGVGV